MGTGPRAHAARAPRPHKVTPHQSPAARSAAPAHTCTPWSTRGFTWLTRTGPDRAADGSTRGQVRRLWAPSRAWTGAGSGSGAAAGTTEQRRLHQCRGARGAPGVVDGLARRRESSSRPSRARQTSAPLQAGLSAGRSDRFYSTCSTFLSVDGIDLTRPRSSTHSGALAAARRLRRRHPWAQRHFTEKGDVVLHHACRLGLEGIVSKLETAPYRSGRASVAPVQVRRQRSVLLPRLRAFHHQPGHRSLAPATS